MKLWCDDIRVPPDETWVWVRNLLDARTVFHNCRTFVTEIAFDHDAGTGHDKDDFIHLAKDIEALAAFGVMTPVLWSVHSANPVGAKVIQATMESAERYWKQNGEK